MRKSSNHSIFLLLALFIIQCKPANYFTTDHSLIAIESKIETNSQTDSLIKPYQENLAKEMKEVLVISSEEFPKEKEKAETKLGNFIADLSLQMANLLYYPSDYHTIDFCFLNNGGLRTSLPKGEITRGQLFELMPFENELVVVTISQTNFDSLVNYTKKVGGQPISGVKFNFSTATPVIKFKYRKNDKLLNGTYKVLTSDYLANGGDNMSFFLNPIAYEPVGIKLRDAIIQYCIQENTNGKQLVGKLDGRITYE